MGRHLDASESTLETEPARVALVRACLRHWPLARGRGIFLRLVSPFLLRPPFVFQLRPGVIVPGELDDYMFLHYFVHGHRLDPSFPLCEEIARPGDTVVDVGANLGFWLLPVARRAGPTGSVHAFEPLATNLSRLRRHLRLNHIEWVQCYESAVGAAAGEQSFVRPAGGNSGVGLLAPGPQTGGPTVRVTTLDRLCREKGLDRIDLLKVDVEGAEHLVFQGGKAILGSSSAPIILFEVGETLATRFGTTPAGVKALLEGFGYSIHRYASGRLETVTREASHPASEDLLALRPEHFADRPALARLETTQRRPDAIRSRGGRGDTC